MKPEADITKIDLLKSNPQDSNRVEDEDVANERDRILNNKLEKDPQTDIVKLVNVTKIFKRIELKKLRVKKHVAVNNLCLGILICFNIFYILFNK